MTPYTTDVPLIQLVLVAVAAVALVAYFTERSSATRNLKRRRQLIVRSRTVKAS